MIYIKSYFAAVKAMWKWTIEYTKDKTKNVFLRALACPWSAILTPFTPLIFATGMVIGKVYLRTIVNGVEKL